MDRARAEAMHGYFLAVREVQAVDDALLDRRSFNPYGWRRRYNLALDEEHAAVEECLAEGVTLEELDALAAMAGSRFAPSWARERFEVIG